MNKVKCLLAAALASIALVSCQKDKFPFTDVARLQFGPVTSKIYDPSAALTDTLKKYTFVYGGVDKTRDTVFFDLYASGGGSTIDRPITLKQVEVAGANNAVAGQHYRAFDDVSLKEKYIIKAGQVHTRIPIVLLRDASLKTMDVVLKFQVQENDAFKYGEAACLWRKVTFTDRLSKPVIWDTYSNTYLGAYSVTKQKFMIDHTGQPWDQEWIANTFNDTAQWLYWTAVCKTAWIDYNNAHPTDRLKDENGALIVFP